MKAQFKYAFRAGGSARLPAFAVIFTVNLVFLVLGALGLLPIAAKITAVALSGTAIAVMFAFNIVGDVMIIRRIFSAPGAYFYALTPAPRRQILASSVITMMILDIITMAAAITGVTLLSISLAGEFSSFVTWESISATGLLAVSDIFMFLVSLIAVYLLGVMIILFCLAMRKSVFYNIHAGGLLTTLLAVGVLYVISLSHLLLIPFGTVTRFASFYTIHVGRLGMFANALLLFIIAAILFVLTSKLLERKVNI
jgi:hypothetical protein